MIPRYKAIPFLLQKTVILPLKLVYRYFLHWEVYGADRVSDVAGPIIFAPNHASELDATLIPVALPFLSRRTPMFFVARDKSYYDKKIFGWRKHLYGGIFFRSWGAYPAYAGSQNYDTSLVHIIHFLKHDEAVCIFPEGGMTKDGKLREARGGIGYLSAKTNATIIPVAIYGTYRLSCADFFRKKRKVVIQFGKPITTQELFGGHVPPDISPMYKHVSAQILAEVQDMLTNIDKRLDSL